MRKYFYRIVESEKEDNYPEGKVEIRDKPRPTASTVSVGDKFTPDLRDIETGEKYDGVTFQKLGYHDFEDEEDYKSRVLDVVADKLDELGVEHNLD